MSGNCELGRGLRRRKKNATEAGAGRFEKPALDARAAPPEAHESLISRKTFAEVPLTGLSLCSKPSRRSMASSRSNSEIQSGSGRWWPGTSSRFRPALETCSWIGLAGTFSGVAGWEVPYEF